MKIIDLLNKIANGEEVPKKIKFKNNIYKWIERNDNVCNYKQECKGRLIDNYLCDDWFMDSESVLNDEVEILEEEKKIPEKIKIDNEDRIQALSTGNFVYKVNQPTKNIIYKINEIMDYLDYLKRKGE